MYRIVLLAVAAIVCLLGLSFHVKNEHLVTLDYYLGSIEYHFSVFILVSIIVGALLGILATLPKLLSQKQRIRHLSKQIEIKNKEVNNLRTIPIKDNH